MSGKKYVPDGVWLTCDKGTCFSVFKIMFHKQTDIYGSNMATEGDRWPFLNIKPMGLCSVLSSLCTPSPVLWKDPKEGIMIGGNQMLLEDSTAMCLFGGTIQIHFTLEAAQAACPFGSFKRPSEYIKEGFDWVFENMNQSLTDVRAGLAKAGVPNWLQSGVDALAWSSQASVAVVEGVANAVVGLGQTVWDITQDPVGVGTAICEGVAKGATKAVNWMSKPDNWENAANSSWDYVTSPDKWAETAKDAGKWVADNPRKVGNVAGEVVEAVAEVALTGGLATAGKKAVAEGVEQAAKEAAERAAREAAEKAAKEAAERAAREGAEEGVKKSLPKVITKEGAEEGAEKGSKQVIENLKPGDKLPDWKGPVDYTDIKNPKTAGGEKNFTKSQKEQIYEKNRAANDGYLVSDKDGTILEKPQKSMKDVEPSKHEAQIDHKHPKSLGGENKGENAQVLSREQNRAKSNKIP